MQRPSLLVLPPALAPSLLCPGPAAALPRHRSLAQQALQGTGGGSQKPGLKEKIQPDSVLGSTADGD